MEVSERVIPLNIVMTYPVHWNRYKVYDYDSIVYR